MARPVKNSCDYFPHDVGMRNHRKIKSLRQKFGVTGYAVWCMLLELLTGCDGNVFEDSEIELEIISGDFGVSVTEIRGVLDYCYKLELLFVNNGFVSSESLDERLKPVYDKRKTNKSLSAKQKRISGKFVSNTEDSGVTDAETTVSIGVTEAETPQSKVKESKVNKTIPLGEFGEKTKLPFLKVKHTFLETKYEDQDVRLKAKYDKKTYQAYCSFIKSFVKFEECVSEHSFIGIEFFSENILNQATESEISKAVTKMCGLTLYKGASLTARFLDVLEMVKPKTNQQEVKKAEQPAQQNEWWRQKYGERFKTFEEFEEARIKGEIDPFND